MKAYLAIFLALMVAVSASPRFKVPPLAAVDQVDQFQEQNDANVETSPSTVETSPSTVETSPSTVETSPSTVTTQSPVTDTTTEAPASESTSSHSPTEAETTTAYIPSTTTEASNELDGGEIAGIVIGTLAGVGLIGFGIYYMKKKEMACFG